MGEIANRQSLPFSERGQLSDTTPMKSSLTRKQKVSAGGSWRICLCVPIGGPGQGDVKGGQGACGAKEGKRGSGGGSVGGVGAGVGTSKGTCKLLL